MWSKCDVCVAFLTRSLHYSSTTVLDICINKRTIAFHSFIVEAVHWTPYEFMTIFFCRMARASTALYFKMYKFINKIYFISSTDNNCPVMIEHCMVKCKYLIYMSWTSRFTRRFNLSSFQNNYGESNDAKNASPWVLYAIRTKCSSGLYKIAQYHALLFFPSDNCNFSFFILKISFFVQKIFFSVFLSKKSSSFEKSVWCCNVFKTTRL